MHKPTYGITVLAVIFCLAQAFGVLTLQVHAQAPSSVPSPGSFEGEGQSQSQSQSEEKPAVEQFVQWLRDLGKNWIPTAPTAADESRLFNPPQSERSFDLIEYLRKQGNAEETASPFAAARKNGSLRLAKKQLGGDRGNGEDLFTALPAWVRSPGAPGRGTRSGRRAAGRQGSAQLPFDLYLWFLTGLPEKRIRISAREYRARH